MIALDFMENFILKNEEENSHFGNIKFVQADVTQFDLDDGRYRDDACTHIVMSEVDNQKIRRYTQIYIYGNHRCLVKWSLLRNITRLYEVKNCISC